MGSGFFNVYRGSDQVYLLTRKDGIQTQFLDQPIRQQERVIDIERHAAVNRTTEPNGTAITVIFTPVNQIATLSEIFYFVQNVLAVAHPVRLNDHLYSVSRTLILSQSDFECYAIPENYPSWIWTKGVPFADLVSYFSIEEILPKFLQEEMTTGTIVNILHGGYTPVQTRTRINISDQKKIQLKEFLLMASYRRILQKYLTTTNPDHYIRNSNSIGPLTQLRFNIMRIDKFEQLDEFLLYYSNEGEPLAKILNDVMKHIGVKMPDGYQDYLKRKIQDPLKRDVVWKWIRNKNQAIPEYEKISAGLIPRKKKEETIVPTPRFLTVFIEIYWELGKELKIPQTNFQGPPPKLVLTGSNDFYSPDQHQITLNPDRADKFLDMITQLKKLTSEDLIKLYRNPISRQYIGVQYPSATLIHELTHAWRRTAHEESHQPISLTIHKMTKEYSFEESANVIYQLILERGLTDRLIQVIRRS